MAIFGKFVLATAAVVAVGAAPWEPSKYSTHGTRIVSRDFHVETYHPKNIYKTFGDGVETPLKKRGEPGSVEDSASSFVESQLGIGADGFKVRSSAATDIGGHVYFQQVVNGIPVANAVANVGLNGAEKVVAFGANFNGASSLQARKVDPTTPALSKEDAIASAEQKLGGTHTDKEPTIEYYVLPNGKMVLVYVVEVQTASGDHWYEAFVDAATGEIRGANDFVSEASYNAVDPTAPDVTKGYRNFVDPADAEASPKGWHTIDKTWHTIGNTTSTDTSGNNAISYKGWRKTTTQQSADGQVFNYSYDTAVEPTTGPNTDAARVNAFVLSNIIHDINYRYGFTEKTYNFQHDNYGKGGRGDDRIKISVQDKSDINNANFATPSDGTAPLMRLFLWTRSAPARDSSLSNDIIAHEQTHGTTDRMTGGGTGRCLQTNEARSLGEGWSDAFADWLQHKDASIPDFLLSVWVSSNRRGTRSRPYSTNPETNRHKYSTITYLDNIHAVGEVWANMLHNVYAELVTGFGWAEDSKTNADSSSGNVVFLRNFYDALLLQPCNPTMTDARDAWIQADKNRYGGIHVCAIWKAFASRGLGVKAFDLNDDFTVPESCSS